MVHKSGLTDTPLRVFLAPDFHLIHIQELTESALICYFYVQKSPLAKSYFIFIASHENR